MRIVALGLLIGCGDPDGADRPGGRIDDAPSASPHPAEPGGTAAFGRARSTPLLGGTLLAAADPNLVFVSDPESDRLIGLDTRLRQIAWSVELAVGDEPFRLAEAGGAVFATLRGGAALARVDLATHELTVIPACADPRGITWDEPRGALWVACASGELEERDATGALVASTWVAADLRDVVALDDVLMISRFRDAEILTLDPVTRAVLATRTPRAADPDFVPRVAWRMIRGVGDDVVVTHQLHLTSTVPTDPVGGGAYGSTVDACGIVQSALATFPADGGAAVSSAALLGGALPVDVARRGWTFEIAYGAGNEVAPLVPAQQNLNACVAVAGATRFEAGGGHVAAVAFDGAERRIVAKQAPFSLSVDQQAIGVAAPRYETPTVAFELFHDLTPSGLSCASCHPDGSDDAHVWDFGRVGLFRAVRRTQNLGVGLAATAPFHWDGEFAHTSELLADVMVGRMGGAPVEDPAADALLAWMDDLPAVRVTPSGDAAAIARGAEMFASPQAACLTCHAGPSFTRPGAMDIGHGQALETPSLVGVGYRGPWMHDGCAATLADRFLDLECGGTKHGGTIDAADVPDLVAYLETL